MNKIATTKRKTITAIFALFMCVAIAVAVVLGVSSADEKSADALAGTTNAYLVGEKQDGSSLTEIWDTQAKNFKADVVDDLVNALLPSGQSDLLSYVASQNNSSDNDGTTTKEQVNMATITANSGKANGILVRLGGVDWMVTYLTKMDVDGTPSVVATLYSAEVWDTVQFHTSNSANTQLYNNAAIRTTLKTQVAAKASFLLDTSEDGFATKYVVQPKYIPWQQPVNGGNNSAQANFHYGSLQSNETALGAWGDDYYWLPSLSETYHSPNYYTGSNTAVTGGLWKMNAAQRGFTTTTLNGKSVSWSWLRTGSTSNSSHAYVLSSSGSDYGNNVTSTNGLRPALHINLTSAALGAASGPTDPTDVSTTYTGAAQTLKSICNNGASAPTWYDAEWYEGLTTQALETENVGKPRVNVEYYTSDGAQLTGGATTAGTYWVKVSLTDAALSERKKEVQTKDPSADLSNVNLKFKGTADTSDAAHQESDTVRWFKLTIAPKDITLSAPVYNVSTGLAMPALAGGTGFIENDASAPQIALKISGTPAGGATYATTIVGDLTAEADKLPKFKGSYSATAILATENADGTYTEYATANYALTGDAASRTTNFTLNFTVLPKLNLTGDAVLPYTGAALSFAVENYTDDWKNIATATPSDGLNWNADGTAVTATDAGKYTLTLAIKDEYKALYGWEGSTSQNTDDIVLNVEITSAALTLTLPTAGNQIYVGQKLSDHMFGATGSGATFMGGSAYCAADGKNVEGVFAWTNGDTAVTKGLASAQITFTPTSGNYQVTTADMAIAPTQMTVTVKEIDKKVEGSTVNTGAIISTNVYEVNYGATFTFATDADKNGALADYAGYTKAYYNGYDATNGVGTDKISAANVNVTDANTQNAAGNTRNLTVYVGYEAQTVSYKVAHVYQNMDGTVLTEAQIRAGLTQNADGSWSVAGYDANVVAVEKKDATAGTLVSAEAKERLGFALKDVLEGCSSRYIDQAVEGDGSTLLIIYYARQTYKINWMLNGGSLAGKYQTSALMEGTVTRPEQDPTLHGYTFDGWYLDAEFKNPVPSWPVSVAGKDLYFYAKWNVVTYTIYYDYNVGMVDDDVNGGTLHGWGKPSSDVMSQTYSAESFENGALRLPKPTAGGFVFAGWQIRDTGKKISYLDPSYAQDITLVATWTHARITIQFDENKGSSNIIRKIPVTNFGTYPALEDPKARNGYTFDGWFTDAVYGTQVVEGDVIRLTATQTLYAHWTPETYTFALPDDFYDKADIEIVVNGEISDEFAEVIVGDRVQITITPKNGYKINGNTANAVTVAGNSFRNGNVYLVQPLSGTDKTIAIAAILEYEVYNIDYDLAGGRGTGNFDSRSTDYTIATTSLTLPTANDVAREGYNFGGWYYRTESGDLAILTDDANYVAQFVETAKHQKLIAQWSAKDQTIKLDYNYAGSATLAPARGQTGATIEIPSPSRTDYVFLGWAETPDGAAVYTPVDGVSEYTVTAKEDVTLYAKWHIASVQFVVVTIGNNNCVYGAGNKITLSGVPYLKYQDTEHNITLIYRWYKVDDSWQKVTEQRSAQEGEYIVPADATPVATSQVGAGTSLPLTTPAFYDGITTVAQSGTYVCVLTASDGKTSTVSQGVAEVQMQKADFVGAALADGTARYDGTQHTVALTVNGTTVTNSHFELPDGSVVEATYSYQLTGASSQILSSAKNAGMYKVSVAFKFVTDVGNYNLPDTLAANLEILPKEIENLAFTLETNISGLWKPVTAANLDDGALGVVFNTANFRVVATSSDVLAKDVSEVQIVLSQHTSGNVLYTAREVGEYLAVAESLSGTMSGNYTLTNGLPMQHWTIQKADRDMRGISFANDSFIYDGTAHVFGVNGTLPAGVTVSYTVEYTAWEPTFSLDVMSIAPNGYVAAGIYVVTAVFTDTDTNYNPIADMVATLTVNRAKYEFDETQLNKDQGVNGMYESQSVPFTPNANYLPQMNLNSATFEVSYKFERQLILGDDNSWQDITQTVLKNNGFGSSGKFRVTASVKFIDNAELLNNYGTIDDVTILFSIADGDIDSVDIAHATAGYAYVYGGKLDVNNLSVVIHYANGDENVRDFSVCTFYETNGTLKGEPFKTFNRVTDNYLIWVECYGHHGIISVKVGQSSFDVSGVAFENSAIKVTFDGANHLPILANASNNYGIVDAFTKLAAEGVTFNIKYYVGSIDGTFATDAVEYDSTKLLNVGRYKVYAYVEVAGTDNYKEIGLLGCVATVEITPLTVDETSGVQLIWQWKKAGEDDSAYKTLTDGTEFVFFGQNYDFRLYFEGLNNTGSHVALPGLKLDGAKATEIKNCGTYELTATSPSDNYIFTETTTVTVLQKEVELVWKANSTNGLDGTDLAATLFTYSGADQLTNIGVYYADVFGNMVKVAGLKATTGNTVIGAGDYVITFEELGDANYKVKEGVATSANITVDPFTVTADRDLVWQYQDAKGNWQNISANLTYKGAEYKLRLTFNGLGSDGTLKADAVAENGAIVKNATDGAPYVLHANDIANYTFDETSVVLNLEIDKYLVTVSWNYTGAFTYNGAAQSLAATAFGVGDDSETMLLDVNAMELTQTAAGNYISVSALTAFAQANYELVNEEANLSKEWQIKPAVLNFTWATDGATNVSGKVTYTYNGTAFAPVANPQVAVVGDEHGAKYQIQKKVDGAYTNVSEAKEAVEYRVIVEEVGTNYTLEGAKNTEQVFVIQKATPVITNVTYEQYAVDGKANVTYRNNGALRNDKLVFVATADGFEKVEGSIAFTSQADILATLGNVTANWSFTPTDTQNFNTVNGTIILTVLAQQIKGLGFEFGSSATTNYLKGMTFNSKGIDVYLVYDSFQKEGDAVYGRRDLLDKANVDMKIGSWPAESYTVRTDDVTNTYIEVNCYYNVGGTEYTGSFRRNVIPGVPDTIEILQKAELESLVLYENSHYDIATLLENGIDLKVTYVEAAIGTKNYKIDDGIFKIKLNGADVTDQRLDFGAAGTYVLTVEFVDISDSLTFTVKEKETLNVSFADKKAVLEEGATYAIPEPYVIDGGANKTLAERGLTVSFTLEDGTPIKSISSWGTYKVTAKFAFIDAESDYAKRYALPADVDATFTILAPNSYSLEEVAMPDANVKYSGNAVDYRVTGYKVMFGDEEITPDSVTAEYTVNGAYASAAEVTELIVNAGTYAVEFKLRVVKGDNEVELTQSYTITVETAQNKITDVYFNSWKEGATPAELRVEALFGADRMQCFYLADEENGDWQPYTAEVASAWKAGEEYLLKAVIPEYSVDGAVNYEETFICILAAVNVANISTPADENGVVIGEISNSNPDKGVAANGVLSITKISDEEEVSEITDSIEKAKQEYGQAYDITFTDKETGAPIGTDGKYVICLLIDEQLRDKKDLKVYYIDDEGNATDMNATRDGDYLVFEMEHFSTFVVTTPAPNNGGWIAGVIIGGIIALVLVIAVIVIFRKKRKGGN